MGILEINNRTENWKTAKTFSSIITNGTQSRLAANLSDGPGKPPGEVKLELFWKGMRDYVHQNEADRANLIEKIAGVYDDRFRSLKDDIAGFHGSGNGFRDLQHDNYDVTTKESRSKLFNNVLNTEIDIVLENSSCVFIGEAKSEMGFGADSKLVLVHQLVRQYVTTSILMELIKIRKQVIPFVVGESTDSLKKTNQVKFMISQDWLQADNVLSWDDIEDMAH